ncbi:hypothetical protein [Niveibacterium sp. SC-1]|uniref:hypothetical protein n=1 Tax=Niveibacterium sp. SC-1 TaxID=3135646 RepID=UPI00311D4347
MIKRIKQAFAARWAQQLLVPAILRRRVFAVAIVLNLLAAVYWGFVASDRYVSEAKVIVQRTDIAASASMDFGGLLSGFGSRDDKDQLLLREYLRSIDVLQRLDARLGLRKHYSDHKWDPISRFGDDDPSVENFHFYFLNRVSVDYDEYAGVLVVKVQAFDREVAHAIAAALVEEGERHLNEMGHSLAREQVRFLEQQVTDMNQRVQTTRKAVLDYQNTHRLVSPQSEVEKGATIVGRLEGQLVELNTKRTAMLAYLMPESPRIEELDAQIAALRSEIKSEKNKLAAPEGSPLNATVEEYQRLTIDAEFAFGVYKTALVALEKGRVESVRTLKKVSVLQAPTQPEYPLQPRRLYSFFVFLIVSMMVAAVVHLAAAIVRDHKD